MTAQSAGVDLPDGPTGFPWANDPPVQGRTRRPVTGPIVALAVILALVAAVGARSGVRALLESQFGSHEEPAAEQVADPEIVIALAYAAALQELYARDNGHFTDDLSDMIGGPLLDPTLVVTVVSAGTTGFCLSGAVYGQDPTAWQTESGPTTTPCT